MENVVNFISWALTHAKKKTVPDYASFPIKRSNIGSDPWEYLYGTTGQKVTQSLLDERWKNHYSKSWSRENYLNATRGWVERGATVCDCQGLLDYYLKNDTNADGNYRKYCTNKGKTSDIKRPYVIGEAVFNGTDTNKTHVGWVCGFTNNGEPLVIHERGLAYGCVITSMSEFKWSYRGLMTNKFIYDSEGTSMPKILKITNPLMRGEDVKQLQIALNALGYPCGTADGICGKQTMKAVNAFSSAHSNTPAVYENVDVTIKVGNTTYAGTIKKRG